MSPVRIICVLVLALMGVAVAALAGYLTLQHSKNPYVSVLTGGGAFAGWMALGLAVLTFVMSTG